MFLRFTYFLFLLLLLLPIRGFSKPSVAAPSTPCDLLPSLINASEDSGIDAEWSIEALGRLERLRPAEQADYSIILNKLVSFKYNPTQYPRPSLEELRSLFKALKIDIHPRGLEEGFIKTFGLSDEVEFFTLEERVGKSIIEPTEIDLWRKMSKMDSATTLNNLDPIITLRNKIKGRLGNAWDTTGEIAQTLETKIGQARTHVIQNFSSSRHLPQNHPSVLFLQDFISDPSHIKLAQSLIESPLDIGGRSFMAPEIFEILSDLKRTSPDGYLEIMEGLREELRGPIYHAYVGRKLSNQRRIIQEVTYEPRVLDGRGDLLIRYQNGAHSIVETKAGLDFTKNSKAGLHFQRQLERYQKILIEGLDVEGNSIKRIEIHYPGGNIQPWIQEEIKTIQASLPPGKRIDLYSTR